MRANRSSSTRSTAWAIANLYIMRPVDSLAAERKALLFSAGGVRLALRVSHVREIVAVAPDGGEVRARGEPIATAFVSTVLGLPGRPGALRDPDARGPRRAALRVEALHGIVDLAEAEFFQLPARTRLPQPPPFSGAVVAQRGARARARGRVARVRAHRAGRRSTASRPPDVGAAAGARAPLRAGRADLRRPALAPRPGARARPRVAPVPLAPPSHRGLLYHGRALHPVLDVAVLYGDAAGRRSRTVLLLDAGGAGVGVVADRVLGVGDARRGGSSARRGTRVFAA